MSDPLRSHAPVHAAHEPHSSAPRTSWLGSLLHRTHSHASEVSRLDPALATRRGIWALKVSLVVLLLTALFQVGIALSSGSVALLADTLHNFSDALTAIPLWLAFNLIRRARSPRYTYGYGRAEDLAGAAIVGLIFLSALEVFYQSFERLLHPMPISNLGWIAAAAVIGFLGNELVAFLRLRVGREIHSAALEADGLHSQVDGFTSLGVLAGVVGVKLGLPWVDPLIGFGIGATILYVTWGAAREIWYRLMDAADPVQVAQAAQVARATPGVLAVDNVRLRWLGHSQECELTLRVAGEQSIAGSNLIMESVRHALQHALPSLQEVTLQVAPFEDQPPAGMKSSQQSRV